MYVFSGKFLLVERRDTLSKPRSHTRTAFDDLGLKRFFGKYFRTHWLKQFFLGLMGGSLICASMMLRLHRTKWVLLFYWFSFKNLIVFWVCFFQKIHSCLFFFFFNWYFNQLLFFSSFFLTKKPSSHFFQVFHFNRNKN